MNIKKILSYAFGIFFLVNGIWSLFGGSADYVRAGLLNLSLAFLILPSFNYLCGLLNKRFTIVGKVILGVGTFIIYSIPVYIEEPTIAEMVCVMFLSAVFFWYFIFAVNPKKISDINNRILEEESDKTDIFHKLSNVVIKRRNEKIISIIEKENKVRDTFKNLDIFSSVIISRMIGESKEKSISRNNYDMPKIDIEKLIISFYLDMVMIKNEGELNSLYTTQYYMSKINNDCSELSKYIKKTIKDILPPENKGRYIEFYNNYLNTMLGTMKAFVDSKYYRNILKNEGQEYSDELFFNSNSLDIRFRDAYAYLIDVLATSTCIAKELFVRDQVKQLNSESEFYKIIANMLNEIKDIDTIIKKSKPIYDEFYKSSLGYVEDEMLYIIAIDIMTNNMKNIQNSEEDEKVLAVLNREEKINDISEINKYLEKWILSVAYTYRNLEIEKLTVIKIYKEINKDNTNLLLYSLGEVKRLSKLYYDSVDHNEKKSDKDRYLKGDFNKEKKEFSEMNNLNSISSGTEFELYLVKIFKELGYKVKHCGKTGDQGADLIVEIDKYKYAVQAKFYTGNLGNTPIQEISGALKYYEANQGVVITNSKFTKRAVELAKVNNVILIDGDALNRLIGYTFDDSIKDDILKKFE